MTVEIVTGTEHWERGEIALSVSGDGEAVVRIRRSGQEQRFEGRVDAAEVDALTRALAGIELPGRAAATEPGDTAVRVTVRRGKETVQEGEAWYSRRWDDTRLDEALRRYDAIVDAVTAGAL